MRGLLQLYYFMSTGKLFMNTIYDVNLKSLFLNFFEKVLKFYMLRCDDIRGVSH